MKLYCLRHGETNYSRLDLCNDDPNRDVHITEAGKRQDEEAVEHLKDLPLERIITSELQRTLQTADIINRYHELPVHVHPLLNDNGSGFDDRPVSEYFAATCHDRLHVRANGGESLLDYKARVLGFIDWLQEQPEGLVRVVAHEEMLRVLKVHFERLVDEVMGRLMFKHCELYAFETE